MAYSPTLRQLALLRFVAGYQAAHAGATPTRKAMRAAIGRAESSDVERLLLGLQERGHVALAPRGGGDRSRTAGCAARAGRVPAAGRSGGSAVIADRLAAPIGMLLGALAAMAFYQGCLALGTALYGPSEWPPHFEGAPGPLSTSEAGRRPEILPVSEAGGLVSTDTVTVNGRS